MSSRLTATQVIERGDYLDPDFDPTTLTIPHLLSILTLHGVKYPTPHSKSKLVIVFNNEIAPRAGEFKKERLRREGSVASSQGIKDGITGRSMSDDEQPQEQPQEQPPPRRSSRRLSRPPSQTPPPTKPEPPKRRRSSAGPSLSRAPSKVTEPQQPVLIEESEPEEEPVKKVGRPRKSAAAAGPQGRKVSQNEDMEGWSDNNVFQPGADSSSPTRPSPNGRATGIVRRSTRRGRTSLSAPPQIPSSSPSSLPPSSPNFDPRLPATAIVSRRNRFAQGQVEHNDAFARASRRLVFKAEQRSSSPFPEEDEEEEQADGDADSFVDDVDLNAQVSKAIANGGSEHALARRNPPVSQVVPTWARLILGIVALTLAGITGTYKVDSASIGYCHPGTNTNPILGERQVARMAAQECTERLAHHSDADQDAHSISCTPLPLIPLPEPAACTSCPAHAYCTPHTVTCEQSFVLRQHPLAHVPYLAKVLNGLPGLGPVALPSSCVEDEERRRNIGRLGVGLEHYLALTRGQRLCMGITGPPGDGGEAAQWGVDLDKVHGHLKKVTVQKKVVKEEEFESLFEQAVADLQRYGYVTMGRDSSGAKYIAAVRSHLDLACKLRVAGRDAWNQWKAHIFGSILLILSAYWTKGKIATRQIENRRVSDLVQVALDTLYNQELAHHTDPVTAPRAYLSSLHLRDLILQDEHSIPARRRLWDKVQKVVEGNTNVRASMEELEGGDEGRVWRWIGGAQRKNIQSP